MNLQDSALLPKCLGHKKDRSFLANHLLVYYMAWTSLPACSFTCSSYFFCNIALNGLPDVDLGIYNEDLNHKMPVSRGLKFKKKNQGDDKYLIHNLDPTM
jgi:hypothetical protein